MPWLIGPVPVAGTESKFDLSADPVRLLRLTLAFPESVFEPTVGLWLRVLGDAPAGLSQAALVQGMMALRRRRAMLLPPGGSAEAIAEHAHRWSVGVLVAAVLEQGEAPCASRWGRFGATVPAQLQAWLAQAPGLLEEIAAWLGEGKAQGAGAIAALLGGVSTVEVEGYPARVAADDPGPLPINQIALEFLRWLDAGIGSGLIACNAPGALIHGVADGLLLVSPRVFEACVRDPANGGIEALAPAGMTVKAQARRLQSTVLNAGLHRRAAGGESFLCARRTRPGGGAAVTGLVLERPERFLRNLPPVDSSLGELSAGPADRSAL